MLGRQSHLSIILQVRLDQLVAHFLVHVELVLFELFRDERFIQKRVDIASILDVDLQAT